MLPSGNLLRVAIEAMAIEIVSFLIKNGGSFQFVMLVYHFGYGRVIRHDSTIHLFQEHLF